jgi:hypothetical protein
MADGRCFRGGRLLPWSLEDFFGQVQTSRLFSWFHRHHQMEHIDVLLIYQCMASTVRGRQIEAISGSMITSTVVPHPAVWRGFQTRLSKSEGWQSTATHHLVDSICMKKSREQWYGWKRKYILRSSRIILIAPIQSISSTDSSDVQYSQDSTADLITILAL